MILALESLRANGLNIGDDIVSAELVQGRQDLAREAAAECPVCGEPGGILVGVLYLRTDRGSTLGSGAHAGFCCMVHLACADWDAPPSCDDIRIEKGGKTACVDCIAEVDGDTWKRLRKAPAGASCYSCDIMWQEAEDAERQASAEAQR